MAARLASAVVWLSSLASCQTQIVEARTSTPSTGSLHQLERLEEHLENCEVRVVNRQSASLTATGQTQYVESSLECPA